ncbi:MAG TPA: sigma-54 dependent transcriptional regulator [Stellaceae bacterium]|nr:sigma-54 dependent transcriptional regulator [Stellaceae bacterium]
MASFATIMIIDDDKDMRWVVRHICGEIGVRVEEAASGRQGLELMSKGRAELDAVLLDMRLPDAEGDEMLCRLRHLDRHLPVVVVTGYGSIPGALQAVRAGAFDYVTKPFRNEELAAVVKRAIAHARAEGPRRKGGLRAAIHESMGCSAAVEEIADQLETISGTDYSVLILGETGTGKELVARALHEYGPRRAKPFVAVDCGALVDTLADSELFGHEKGAFTGAIERRRGRFELASGGVLFLDEIGNLSQSAQRSLLRALDNRMICRVGGTAPVPLDLRVVAATNEMLSERVATGSFRADLYFRLAELSIALPPLRARPDDIEYLACRFLAEACLALGKPSLDMTAAALSLLRGYDWPGNVRELRNVVRRAALAAAAVVLPAHIAGCLGGRSIAAAPAVHEADTGAPLYPTMQDRIRSVERGALLDALAQARGNKAQAARLLGVDYKTFRTKLKTLGDHGPGRVAVASLRAAPGGVHP